MKMNQAQIDRMMAFVSTCTDAKQLRQIAINAQSNGASDLKIAATRRLYEILPAEQPGTFEYDVWHSIHALEGSLSDERDKTTRLSRTRQKISRDGEEKTVTDLVLGKQSEGFDLLMARNMPDLTFEALAIKHAVRFPEQVKVAAAQRLAKAGVNPKDFE